MSEAVDLLRSIDTSLKAILAGLRQGATTAAAPTSAPVADAGHVASDYDLNGPYGDPEVKAKSPRDWTGPSMQGKHFSECPAEYLDLVADRLLYFAAQNAADTDPEAQKKARYNRLDAGRAKGWAIRIRAGYTPTPKAEAEPVADAFADSDVPF